MDEIKPFMETLLGLKDPWTLTRIEADLEAGSADRLGRVGEAALQARDEFARTGDPQTVDILIDKGVLVVKSGQTGMEKVGTLRWDAAVAQARMDNILSANYSDGSRVDAPRTGDPGP